MAETEEMLSLEQREVVAIAASVAVGCLPCASYHVQASRKAGLDEERMLAAVAEADRVVADSRERMAAHLVSELGPAANEASEGANLDRILAALGAAIGANSLPNIRRYLIRGMEAELGESRLAQAIRVAEGVQRAAAAGHVKETERLLGVLAAETPSADEICGSDCGCHSREEAGHVL